MKRRAIIFLFFNRIASVFQLPLSQTDITTGLNAEHEALLLRLGYNDTSAIDWKVAFARLAGRHIYLEELLRKERLMASIKSKIEFWEDMLTPNYKFFGKQKDNTVNVDLHKERWKWIVLNCRSDPFVIKISLFIKNHLNGDFDSFCTRISWFFTFTTRSEDIPPLHQYNVEEVDEIMRSKFKVNDNITLELIHFFMKT